MGHGLKVLGIAFMFVTSIAWAAPPSEAVSTSAGNQGQSTCRTRSTADGTTNLVLTWDGGKAKGSLEHVAPSGNATSQRVRAERYNGMIIADDVGETDLVSHAAVVAEKGGKRFMRVGDDKQPWLACQ